MGKNDESNSERDGGVPSRRDDLRGLADSASARSSIDLDGLRGDGLLGASERFNDLTSGLASLNKLASDPFGINSSRDFASGLRPVFEGVSQHGLESLFGAGKIDSISARIATEGFGILERGVINRDLISGFSSVALAHEQRLSAIGVVSPLTESLRAANSAAVSMLGSLRSFSSIIEQSKGIISNAWADPALSRGFLEATKVSFGLELARVSDLSILAETSLTKAVASGFASAFKLPEFKLTTAREEFLGFSSSYESLVTSLTRPETSLLGLPPRFTELPAREFFIGSRLVKSVSVREPEEDESERQSVEAERELSVETGDALLTMLSRLDAGFINMRQGALHALASSNPDRIRHAVTSYRELFTHVLHRLSPDDELRAWSTSPDDFANGKPTRRARLKYVCRHINHGSYTHFVKKDIDAMLAVVDLFQEGTHAVKPSFTEVQLIAFKARVESVIRFLIEIALFEGEVAGH